MPGKVSIEKNQYYANSRNQFWKIMEILFNEELPEDYRSRLDFLLNRKIALWDVVRDCERRGSLDSDIRNPVVNNFEELFINYPGIKTIYFNGGKAYELFRKYLKNISYCPDLIKLPSTSPAHTVKLNVKIEKWASVKKAVSTDKYIIL